MTKVKSPRESAKQDGLNPEIVALKDKKKQKIRKERKCSWCEKTVTHKLVTKHHGLKRSKYQCSNCYKSTVRCRILICDNMSRAHRGWHEGFCIDHTPLYNEQVISAYCSWCFEKTNHKIQIDCVLNRVSRVGKIFACEKCYHPTQHCKKCDEAMCRLSENEGTSRCFKCFGLISSWEDSSEENKEKLTNFAWCPWCASQVNHELKIQLKKGDPSKKESKRRERQIYQCGNCMKETKFCSHCDTSMVLNYSKHSKCLACRRKIKQEIWKVQQERFVSQCEQYSFANAKKEIERSSPQKDKAKKAGLLRPFNLLVSMHPEMRCATAFKLDIPLLRKNAIYGNAHEEANLILFHNKKGLQRRTNSILESAHFHTKCNWYQILRRGIHDLSGAQSTFRSRKAKKTMYECTSPNNDVINALEIELLECVADRYLLMIPNDISAKAKSLYQDKRIYNLFSELHFESIKTDAICVMFISILVVSGIENGKFDSIDQISIGTFLDYIQEYLNGRTAVGKKVHNAQFTAKQVIFFIARIIVVGTLVQIACAVIFPPAAPVVGGALFTVGVGLFVAAFVCRDSREISCQATLLIVFQRFILATSESDVLGLIEEISDDEEDGNKPNHHHHNKAEKKQEPEESDSD